MEWSSVPIEGGVVVGYLPKLYLVKRAWSTRERQDGDPLALGKAHWLYTELLDPELGPCTGIPSQ